MLSNLYLRGNSLKTIIAAIMCTLCSLPTHAGPTDQKIPMRLSTASTYYVDGYFTGYGAVDLMVDTGSSYTVINEEALAVLRENGAAIYVKDLTGIMADGSKKIVPVYRIAEMSIGNGCTFKDIEAAVFAGSTRYILGISTLKKATPFTFSLEPPTLLLSNCGESSTPSPPQAITPAAQENTEDLRAIARDDTGV